VLQDKKLATNKLLVEKKNSSGTIIDRFPVKIIQQE